MRSIDFKSLCIGVLGTLVVIMAIGAVKEAPPVPLNAVPRYQIAVSGHDLFVLDNQSQTVSLLFQKHGKDGSQPTDPWASDSSFSLPDALNKPQGAPIINGPGR